MSQFIVIVTAAILELTGVALGSVKLTEVSTLMMPMTCVELLPDHEPFLQYFETVARGVADNDRQLSKRLFRIVALRERLAQDPEWTRGDNPIDLLIRKTMCFYREQREPLKTVLYDDADFIKFLKSNLRDLETKVDEVVFHAELERFRRKQAERELERNQNRAEALRQEASREARQSFEKLSGAAKRKASIP